MVVVQTAGINCCGKTNGTDVAPSMMAQGNGFMSQNSGLLVIDLQYGFSPRLDLVERIRDAAQEYSVVVATKFVNPPDSLFRRILNDGKDGGLSSTWATKSSLKRRATG